MNDFGRHYWMLMMASLTFAMMACGDRIVLLECPLGSMPQGSACVPYQDQPDISEPAGIDGLADFAVAEDLAQNLDLQGPQDSSNGEEVVAKDTSSPAIGVGSGCLKGADCGEGWSCLNWPGGYCTILDCSEKSCPENSVCMAVSGGNYACLSTCEADGDCRNPDHQACKGIAATEGGDVLEVCYGVSEDAGEVGAECQDPSNCLGQAVCEALSANGYCSIAECEDITCPQGSTCARLQGLYFCLRDCGADDECFQSETSEQECVSLKDPEKKPVQVCSPSEGDKAIGEACVSDVECKSATCQVLGQGRCSQSEKPCDSEADCDGAEFCNTGPQTKVGYCTGACSLNAPCPGAGFCALSDDLNTGTCRSTCPAADEPGTCPLNDGFSCVYGVPFGEFSGKYLCALVAPGDVGSPCSEVADCPSGTCVGAEDGYCVQPCSADFGCPFPGTCFKDDSGTTSCRPSCLSASDCHAGESCQPALGGLTNACVGL